MDSGQDRHCISISLGITLQEDEEEAEKFLICIIIRISPVMINPLSSVSPLHSPVASIHRSSSPIRFLSKDSFVPTCIEYCTGNNYAPIVINSVEQLSTW